ncbi:MAG: TIM barrel protein [Planctomycetaceae bacterium]|nr:TIM barrel protein [Planctomycetaceae bacterium]
MSLSRRDLLQSAVAVGATASYLQLGTSSVSAQELTLKGRIQHSVVFWCFNVGGDKWTIDQTCAIAKSLGCKSVEICGPETWDTLKKHGLTCAIAPNGMPGAPFMKGLNNPAYHAEVIAVTTKMIDDCAAANVPNVISFTGYKWKNAEDPASGEIALAEGADNCVAALKQLAVHAEKKGVTICLEHLNTRDSSHPMKGHPGYQGDDIDYVANIVRRVGSPRVKLLFDIYHVQIMNGDVIRRLEECKDVIGHIHTAGNPGRAELDDNQEINYPPIMRKLIELGYKGYVGHEFIPTRDPLAGLKQAVELCDV